MNFTQSCVLLQCIRIPVSIGMNVCVECVTTPSTCTPVFPQTFNFFFFFRFSPRWTGPSRLAQGSNLPTTLVERPLHQVPALSVRFYYPSLVPPRQVWMFVVVLRCPLNDLYLVRKVRTDGKTGETHRSQLCKSRTMDPSKCTSVDR